MDSSSNARPRSADELCRRRAGERRRACGGASRLSRPTLPPAPARRRRRPSRPHRHHRPDRARHQVRGAGVGRRSAGPGDSRSPGAACKITLTNKGAIPHSVDFHAARIAPNKAFADVCRASPSATRSAPTIPASSCTMRHQAGLDAHRQRHVRGDRRRAQAAASSRRRTRTRSSSRASGTSTRTGSTSLRSSTWQGARAAARLMTFNGYAGQYVKHPLTAKARRARPLLGGRRRPFARHRLPYRRNDPEHVGGVQDRADDVEVGVERGPASTTQKRTSSPGFAVSGCLTYWPE